MKDQWNREISYMRISVTDRCNLRCVYCMPEEGVDSISHSEVLSFEEITRVCEAAVELGIHRLKITGGEPLVRIGLPDLIRMLHGIRGIEQITLTTNGVLLREQYDALVDAGLDEVTVSIDTLDRERYAQLTRRDELPRVMAALEYACEQGRIPVKVNCVSLVDEDIRELAAVAELAKRYPLHVRFIEMMPIGMGKNFRFLGEDDLVRGLEQYLGSLVPVHERLGNGPAHYYRAEGFQGYLGFISAVSHQFCERCNRVRLTSSGFLKTCLQYDIGVDLREILRGGGGKEPLVRRMETGIFRKPQQHSFRSSEFIDDEENRGMSQIGG